MDWGKLTKPGSREANEDSIGMVEAQGVHCFIVADGLGGHGKGEVASRLAVEAFQKVFKESQKPIKERMQKAFEQAQKSILEEQIKTHAQTQMKTTVVALVVTDDEILWGHIGDTRLYMFGALKTVRTLDHSVPQMLVLTREIKEKEIRNHPDRNRLLRVLGVSGDTPRFELSEIQKRKKRQAFLLCTDGFWELILENEMRQCMKKANTAQEWLELMEEIICKRGEGQDMDNFSAISVLL